MSFNIDELKQKIQEHRGALTKTITDKNKSKEELKKYEQTLIHQEQAREFLKQVALETQKQLEFKISNTVSSALSAVFDDPPGFEIVFEERRGKTECDLWFIRNGHRIHPKKSSGLGAADVAGLALRVVSLALSGKYRNVLILDEPFKHLKGKLENKRSIQLLNQLSKELQIQIITISDERAEREDIIEGADKVFLVTQKNGVSKIKEL